MNAAGSTSPKPSPWLPSIAAVALLGAVVAVGAAGGFSGDSGGADPQDGSGVTRAGKRGTSVSTIAVDTVPKERKSRLEQSLSLGMVGKDVRRLQQRLGELHFDPGPVDGNFGQLTQAAVWAFEKLIMGVEREAATGVVSPQMWLRMQDDIRIRPRRPDSTPTHTEIYLPEQVLILFDADEPSLVTHISSGDGQEWCDDVVISPGEYGNEEGTEPLERRECCQSVTPGGVFTYDRQIEGVRQSALGGMWNPVYFNYGIAVHGALTVPLEPASHGCIRIPLPVSESFQDLVSIGDEVFVFDGVKAPEDYGEQLPVFNKIDPEWLATSTTSTTTTTTTAPPTTAPVPSTAAPTTPAAPPPTDPPPETTTTPPTTVPPPPTTVPPPPPPPTTATTAPPSSSAPDRPGRPSNPGSVPRRGDR